MGNTGPAPAKQDPIARDLRRALEPAPPAPLDTAAQRKRDQLERCKFVYHDEQGLRECLVLKNGWAPQDAAREIAIYKAEIGRVVGSIEGERLAAEERARKARTQAAQGHEDSVFSERERLDGPVVKTFPDSGAWMGDDRTGAYYRTTCAADGSYYSNHGLRSELIPSNGPEMEGHPCGGPFGDVVRAVAAMTAGGLAGRFRATPHSVIPVEG